MSSVKSVRKPKVKKKKSPSWMPSKKPRARRMPVVENPQRTHLELKTYLLSRRLVVERSLNPIVRREALQIDHFIAYLRSIDPPKEPT